MKKEMALVSVISAVVAATSWSVTAVAEQQGITVTPMIGYMDYDYERTLENNPNSGDFDDNAFWALGLGYQFSSPWQVELLYLQGETETDVTAQDVDHFQVRLDGLYHFGRENRVVPYLAFGVGHAEFDEQTVPTFDRKETSLNIGGGLKFGLNDMLSLRADLRAIQELQEENVDYAAMLGLQLLFGIGGDEKPVKKAAVAQVAATQDGDADGDGVLDSIDQCAMTPAGVQVDANGCALDDDGDGVPNHKDDCPNTEAGALVTEVGCYKTLEETRSIELKINFANNSSVVESNYFAQISAVAEFLKQYPETKVAVEGYTDSRGKAEYNQKLSAQRAAAVAAVLKDQFDIDASRVTSVGQGESNPIASNDNAKGRAMNRRVVAVISAEVNVRAK